MLKMDVPVSIIELLFTRYLTGIGIIPESLKSIGLQSWLIQKCLIQQEITKNQQELSVFIDSGGSAAFSWHFLILHHKCICHVKSRCCKFLLGWVSVKVIKSFTSGPLPLNYSPLSLTSPPPHKDHSQTQYFNYVVPVSCYV